MSLPRYQITVIDATSGETNAVYDGAAFDDFKFSRVLNDVGLLAVTMPYTSDLPSIFTLDSLIEVQRTSPLTDRLQTEEVYLTRLMQHFREGDEEKWVVGGFSLNHLLLRRLIDPVDDSGAAGGYSTKSGPADDVLVAYARQQCGDLCLTPARQFPNFSIASSSSIGETVGRRLRYDNLLEVFQDVCNQSQLLQMDFQVVRLTGNSLRLIVYPIGADRSKTHNYPFAPFVELNPKRGNLADPSLLFDRKQEQNFVYALAQGPGESRIVTRVTGDGIGDSPYNRIEFTTDVRNAERGSTSTVLTSARAALYDKQPKKEFTFKPTGTEPGGIYRLDYDLGDTVTCTFDADSFDLRIRGVEMTLSPDNEEISVTVALK
jgi:ReqiPepy6 Gp37-like protein